MNDIRPSITHGISLFHILSQVASLTGFHPNARGGTEIEKKVHRKVNLNIDLLQSCDHAKLKYYLKAPPEVGGDCEREGGVGAYPVH